MSIRGGLRAPALALAVLAGTAMGQEHPGSGAPASWTPPIDDSPGVLFLQADRSESRFGRGRPRYLWDTQGWYGPDEHKLWVKAEGEAEFGSGVEQAEFQALYSRLLTSFFDLQAGIRQDVGPGPSPTYAVLGLQGLAPYWFELDSALFLDDNGDLTARVEAEYDLLFTQRLIGQPRIEFNLAAQDVPELAIGAGLSDVELGLRRRYEIRREIAPYVGVSWERRVGESADFARATGSRAGNVFFVAGIRLWF